jgi:5-methylcytosine-specific restriction endonuclease McrA
MDIIQHQFFTVKKCSECHQVKSTDAFYKCKSSHDGVQSHCKDCTRDIHHAYARLHREELRDASRAYREKNKDKVRAYQRTENSKRLKRATRMRWQKQNPEKNALHTRNYQARKKGAIGRYTLLEWRDLCARFNHQCLRCGATTKLTADHIIPISKGGANTIDNIQPLCMSCNASKGAQSIDYR